jgi:hypothetical protein
MELMSDHFTLKILTCGDIMIRVYGITKLHGETHFVLTNRYKKP